jgi:hypothetical protein
MSAAVASKLAQWRRAVRQRRALIACACALPLAFGVIALAARVGGWRVAVATSLVAFAAAAFAAWRFASRDDGAALARRLDALSPTLEDSAALLWREPGALTPLQQLQRERLESRLANVDVDVRPPWPHRAIFASAVAAFALFVLAAAWPACANTSMRGRKSAAANKAAAGLVSARLAITPPAYTEMPPRSDTALDAKVPQDSTLAWRCISTRNRKPRISRSTTAVASICITTAATGWANARSPHRASTASNSTARHRSATTCIASTSSSIARRDSHRRAGQDLVRIRRRAENLAARIRSGRRLRHRQGRTFGDACARRWRKHQVRRTHDRARRRRARRRASPALSARARSRRVVAREGRRSRRALVVTDNRVPKPNVTRSPSLILRWPADASKDSSGLDGIAQKTMPAYFRSQRQIIIDTEALLADKPALDDAKFLARSDAIGVDQKILRLRYGQFLGEESEGHAEAAIDAGHADANSQVGALAAAHERRKSPRRKARNSATQATSKPNTATSTTSPKPRHCSTRPREPRSNPRSTRCGRRN